MTRHIANILTILLVFVTSTARAQYAVDPHPVIGGGEVTRQSETAIASPKTAFVPRQLIAPSVLATTGATISAIPSAKQKIQGFVRDHHFGLETTFEDKLQYFPAASYLVIGFLPDQALSSSAPHFNFAERTVTFVTATALEVAVARGLKYIVDERRPNGANYDSFPSGHTATAFMGAELVRLEYGNGYGAVAYVAAGTVGFMRIYHDWHWSGDVLAGAAIGILSAQAAYWLSPYTVKILPKGWRL